MICSTIIDSCIEDSSEYMQTKNPLIVSLKNNGIVGCDFGQVIEILSMHSEDMETDPDVHMLFMKIQMIVNLMLLLANDNARIV